MWKKFLNLFTILALFSLLIAPVGGASAQGSGPFEKKPPGYMPTPSTENTTPGTSGPKTITGNLVQDPSFEASLDSQAFWGQFSTNFGSPLCSTSTCYTAGGTLFPHSGDIWAWFGGTTFAPPYDQSPEEGIVKQNVTIPSCGATLQFYFWIAGAAAGSGVDDFFVALMDNTVLFSADATQRSSYPSYTLLSINLSSFADGGVHLLEFYSSISDQNVNFFLDDVSLTGCPGISGHAGIAGATLNYVGSTNGSTTANGSGNYTFDVPPGWSGTVTPSLRCYAFNPASRTYNNVTANQPAQNYTASVSTSCAAVSVRIRGQLQGSRLIPRNTADRLGFTVDSGPVSVSSSNGVPFIVSERVLAPKDSSTPTHFTEMMGLPATLKSTKYFFPVYDNNAFDSQLRFANVGSQTTTVIVTIQGRERSRDTLAPNQSMKRSYFETNGTPVSAGPVVVESTNSTVPIVASLRVLPRPATGSYSEIMGLPEGLVPVGTSYVFPWYNSLDLDTQLRFGNVGPGTTTVTVTIGTIVRSFAIPFKGSIRVSIAGVNAGPVRVTSAGRIVASMRVAFRNGSTSIGFSELMGLPQSQLNSIYHFPWYNNAALDTQLRVANMSGSPATIRVFIAGREMAGSPFTLAAGASTRRSFGTVNNGPMKVVSNQLIVASLRVLVRSGGTTPFISELMGLPHSQLQTAYLFPWYNNIALDTRFRIAVP